jgi:hypothetical protein
VLSKTKKNGIESQAAFGLLENLEADVEKSLRILFPDVFQPGDPAEKLVQVPCLQQSLQHKSYKQDNL